MSEALKPCPFCGDKAILWCEKPKSSDYGWLAACFSCHSQTGYVARIGGIHKTEEAAIAAWNRRASPSWSTEPPTEEGVYCFRFDNAMAVVLVTEYCDDTNLYVSMFGSSRRRELYEFCDMHREYQFVQWLKIDVPAPPEESEVKHD